MFGIETPEGMKAVNHQGELNVHNMFIGANDLIRFAAALPFATVFILGRRLVRYVPTRPLKALVPLSTLAPFMAFILVGVLHDELFEIMAALAIVLYTIDLNRRLRTAGTR